MKIIQAPSPNFNTRPLSINPNTIEKSCLFSPIGIPAQAEIQNKPIELDSFPIDSRFRGNDNGGGLSSEIDSIIIHYTDMVSTEAALAWLINPSSQVSAHYLIDEEGQIYHMVDEKHRAWHAGESYWQGRTNLNDCSIGIELANPGHSHGYTPFPEAQIAALMELCLEIKQRWNIPSSRILGHSDIAPGRKQDPGHLFPWKQLAAEELGMWPVDVEEAEQMFDRHCEPSEKASQSRKPQKDWIATAPSGPRNDDDEKALTHNLSQLGYDTTSPTHSLLAFQRHFQPHKVDGIPDQETHTLLQGLLNSQKMHI